MWNQACSPSSARKSGHKAGKSKKAALQILPCTVSQLLSASPVSSDAFAICDWELNQVSVVGVIRGLSPFVTNVQYAVDDMTGPRLNVKQWVSAEDGAVMTFASLGTYVKVIGNLRNFSVSEEGGLPPSPSCQYLTPPNFRLIQKLGKEEGLQEVAACTERSFRCLATSKRTSPGGGEQRRAGGGEINYLPLINICCDLTDLGRELSSLSSRRQGVCRRAEGTSASVRQLSTRVASHFCHSL